MLFSFFVISAANCGSLLDIMLSYNPCSFYTLFLNNLAKPSTNIPSVVATKFIIFDNQSYTTRIASFPTANDNLVMKSTIKYIYSFPKILFIINFSASAFVLFFILWYRSQLSTYLSTSLVTSGH